MRKGFALLETIVVITVLSVSMLTLYKSFAGLVNDSNKSILYDDVRDIYKAYYLKEYLLVNNFKSLLDNKNIKELDCNDLDISSCDSLFKEMDINKMYVTKYDLKDYDDSKYSSNFNNYINSLSNKGDYKYRFIVEFNNHDTYSYASLGLNGD